MATGADWINRLNLTRHPEGGYFREIYRNGTRIAHPVDGAERDLATSIYFLLESGDISRFHRLKSDELWYFHAGSGVTIAIIDPAGTLHYQKLGDNPQNDETPQVLIPAGSIFGAEVNQVDSYALVGCMVAPGFSFDDFELMSRAELLRKYPKYDTVIKRFTSSAGKKE